MRVMGFIGVQSMVILVDSESTHDFLGLGVAKLAKLKVEEATSLQVRVVNGESLLSKGRCEATMLKIQRKKFLIILNIEFGWL